MNYIKFSLKSLGVLVHSLSKRITGKTNKWAFSSCCGYGDNAKCLSYKICESHREINAIWITHNHKEVPELRGKGLKAFYGLSPVEIYG